MYSSRSATLHHHQFQHPLVGSQSQVRNLNSDLEEHNPLQHHHHQQPQHLQAHQLQHHQLTNATSQHLVHHHTLHHPASHHQAPITNPMNHYHNEQQLTSTPQSQQSIMHHQHQQLQLQLQQQHQKQQLQQQQYNMNSDYSSSTYHIYDQISDLIIIKQQRMERKRQLEHRRKVILIALLATFLVGTLIFLTYQALQASNSYPIPAAKQNAPINIDTTPNQQPQAPLAGGIGFGLGGMGIAGSGSELSGRQRNDFLGSEMNSGNIVRPPFWAPPVDRPMSENAWDSGRSRANSLPMIPIQLPPPLLTLPVAPSMITTTTTTSTTTTTAAPIVNDPPSNAQEMPNHQPETSLVGQLPNVSVERQCDDGLDNDQDGLIDCADSECCSNQACHNSTLCMKSPNPVDTLMKKQPTPPTASFFQRMQFLIEKFSSQIYSNPKDFNNSRASVVRGRVTYMKQGLIGVRVSVAGQINLGMTLSREGGYFDLMVNGGGAVVIEFRREPFVVHQKAVRVPWNEIILMDAVELSIDSLPASGDNQASGSTSSLTSSNPGESSPVCLSHNYRFMKPQIVPVPRLSRKSQASNKQAQVAAPKAVILRDSAIVQQSIPLPGSHYAPAINSAGGSITPDANNRENHSVSLVYVSSRANEFMATINIQMLPTDDQFKVPNELKQVYLKIVIEGNLFEQSFEPQSNLSFVFGWNRRNVYRQKCFGLSNALVSVGYEYHDCKKIVWTTKQIQLPGHDLSISDIDQQWNLNIHHRYNYRDSILQRGDGQNFNLKTDKPKVIYPIMGDGYQRPTVCPHCDGATSQVDQRLFKPQALVSAPDGSFYVGDFNMIRKVEWAQASASSNRQQLSPPATFGSQPSGSSAQGEHVVRTVLELPINRAPSRYTLALNLADQNKLYMSDIDRHQIYLIREPEKIAQSTSGQSIASLASDSSSSQDAGSSNGGGSSQANWDDNLLPVVGNGLKCSPSDRNNCGDGQSARLARLIEPKSLVFDLAGRMYIADGPNVRVVDQDQKIYTLLGNYGLQRHTIFPCSGEAIPMHKFVPKMPQDLAINPIDDSLHILDDNVVYKVTQDKRVQVVAGHLAHCGLPDLATRRQSQGLRAHEIYLQSAQSISFNQNGELFISEDDQKQSISRVILVSPEDDLVRLYAGLPIDPAVMASIANSKKQTTSNSESQQRADLQYLIWAESQLSNNSNIDSSPSNYNQQQQDQFQNSDQQRASNYLSSSMGAQTTTRALDYKFNSISAICVDQQGKLIVADKLQLRLLSVEPDIPQVNSAGEYELISPDNGNEILVFNRHGHQIATRETGSGKSRSSSNKYTFTYSVNTSFGLLTSVLYESGNRITIHRDGPHHVKMIETAFGGQCKLDTRVGQVHSITITAPTISKTNFSYNVEAGGLLKQSRDQASGEMFDFTYDDFGRALSIQHTSPKLQSPVTCRLGPQSAQQPQPQNMHQRHVAQLLQRQPLGSSSCSNLIVAS